MAILDRHNKYILSGTLSTLVIRALASAAVLGMNVLLARSLPVQDYGVIALGISWVTITAAIACVGMDTASMRFIAEGFAKNTRTITAPIFMAWSARLVGGTGLILGLLDCVFFFWLYPHYKDPQISALCVITAAAPLLAITLTRAGALRGAKRPALGVGIAQLLRPIVVISLVGLTSIGLGVQWSLLSVAISLVFAQALALVAALYATQKITLPTDGSAEVARGLNQEKRRWLGIAAPLAVMGVITVLTGNFDTVLVGHFRDPAAAGIYRAAVQLTSLVSFGLAASNGIIAPLIAESYARGHVQKLQQTLRFSVLLVSIMALIGCGFLAMCGSSVLSLFGTAYAAAREPLIILLVGQVLNALCGPTGNMMIMGGRQKRAAQIFAATAVGFVLLSFILIPSFGMAGAAAANVIFQGAWNLAILCYLRRDGQPDPSILSLLLFRRKVALNQQL